MAAITATTVGDGDTVMTVTTLGASDTFVFDSQKGPLLILDNVTGGALTVTIDGDGGTTVDVDGIGAVDVSGGFVTALIGIGAKVVVRLGTIREYLKGTITVTGGTGIEASLLEL
jgi:hypothetical protein